MEETATVNRPGFAGGFVVGGAAAVIANSANIGGAIGVGTIAGFAGVRGALSGAVSSIGAGGGASNTVSGTFGGFVCSLVGIPRSRGLGGALLKGGGFGLLGGFAQDISEKLLNDLSDCDENSC